MSPHQCITGAAVRTTLDIDDDLLAAAKELARREGASAGQIVSRLMRQSLSGTALPAAETTTCRVAGFRPFPPRPGVVVTNAHIDELRDAEGI